MILDSSFLSIDLEKLKLKHLVDNVSSETVFDQYSLEDAVPLEEHSPVILSLEYLE